MKFILNNWETAMTSQGHVTVASLKNYDKKIDQDQTKGHIIINKSFSVSVFFAHNYCPPDSSHSIALVHGWKVRV